MDPDLVPLHHIVDAARRVVSHSHGLDRSSLETDAKSRDAILFALSVVGEAAKRLSPAFRSAHPEVPWAKITGTRDRLIHGYDRIDLNIVWQVVEKSIPELLEAIEPLLLAEHAEEGGSSADVQGGSS